MKARIINYHKPKRPKVKLPKVTNRYGIHFSQKQLENSPLAEQVKQIIRALLPTPAHYRKGLLIKVLFYTNTNWLENETSGSYRCIEKHGCYDAEWDAGAASVITLKIGLRASELKVLQVIAHEIAHHITWVRDRKFGERKADKLAEKLIAKYKAKYI